MTFRKVLFSKDSFMNNYSNAKRLRTTVVILHPQMVKTVETLSELRRNR
jgi:hypothetical protein